MVAQSAEDVSDPLLKDHDQGSDLDIMPPPRSMAFQGSRVYSNRTHAEKYLYRQPTYQSTFMEMTGPGNNDP